MYFKLTYFLYHNFISFSEKNDKKQEQMFYQNHSLALHTLEIFFNVALNLKNLGLPCWTRINAKNT